MSKNDIKIDTSFLSKKISKIPKGDFIDAQFDKNCHTPLTDILILLSTPRSGSTLITDLLEKNGLCLPHEYFQPFQYLPILADRWSCVKKGSLNKQSFLDNLIKFRTYPSGWLGINLHGEHLPIFSNFESMLPNVNIQYVHLIRQNIISQAVSYDIAVQTGKWSSHFKSKVTADYNYSSIKKRVNMIQEQNALINTFLLSRNIPCKTIYYEDLAADNKTILNSIVPGIADNKNFIKSTMKKQSSSTSGIWAERFAKEYFEHNNKNILSRGVKIFEDSSKYIIKKSIKKK